MLKHKICVVGTGYVGLSNAVLFLRQHQVISLDIDLSRVEKINQKILPLVDEYIRPFAKVCFYLIFELAKTL